VPDSLFTANTLSIGFRMYIGVEIFIHSLCAHTFFLDFQTLQPFGFSNGSFFFSEPSPCAARGHHIMSNLDVTVGQKSSKKSLKERQPARQ